MGRGNAKQGINRATQTLDCKTVRIFAYSSTREQSNKSSRTRLKQRARLGRDSKNTCFFFLSPVRLARFGRVRLIRRTLYRFLYWFREKKTTVLQSTKTQNVCPKLIFLIFAFSYLEVILSISTNIIIS